MIETHFEPNDLEELMAMKLGEARHIKGDTSLKEIHRVMGGWIYVFELYGRGISTSFVPEYINAWTKAG